MSWVVSLPAAAQELPSLGLESHVDTPISSPISSSQPNVLVSQTIRDEYTLGAGDEVRVEVFRLPDYGGEYEVLSNGALSLPMVGQVIVSGLTLEQAATAVSQAYASRLRRPIVNVYLIQPRPLRVGIAGEVSQPGEYILEREGTQFPSLVGALEAAGGVTQSADLRTVTIQRTVGTQSPRTMTVNLWQFLQTGDLRYNFALQDGDTIVIPTRERFDPEESLQLAAASFAASESRPLNIAVVGEVFRPGPYTVTGNVRTGDAGIPGGTTNGAERIASVPPTVTRAIQAAGGIQPEADIREVKVYRRTRSGREQVITANLWSLLTDGNLREDVILQEGDTVFIPKAEVLIAEEVAEFTAASFSPDTIRVNVVGEVDSPGVVEVLPNTPLSQGVLAAGGFNNRARKGSVELIRLNPNGTAVRSTIPIDFAEGIDEEVNPLLRNNDTIIVNRSGAASFSDGLDTVVSPLGRAFSLFSIPASIFRLFN